MRAARYVMLGLVMAGAAGCEADPLEPPLERQSLTGRWEALVDGAILDLLLLEELDGTVTGSGHLRLRFEPGSVAFRVEGVSLFPRLSLILRSFGFEDVNLTGVWQGTQLIRARLEGSSFEGELIQMRRRPLGILPLFAGAASSKAEAR